MRFQFMLFSFLVLFFPLGAYADQSQVRSKYLIEPAVSWNGNRMSGELKNISIRGLLEDLIRNKQFGCTIQGQLQGTISIRFDNLTAEEVIRKIMRSKHYNYTIMSTTDHPGIGKLTIYQGDTIVSFNKVPISARNIITGSNAKHLQPPPSPAKTKAPAPLSDERSAERLKKLDGEIKWILDDMLASNKMSQKEYEKALAKMKALPK